MISEWREVKLEELGKIGRGKSRHRPRNAEFLYGESYPFIQTADVKASNNRITSYTQMYSEAGLAQSKLWPKETLCITIAANIADAALLDFEACFPDSILGFTPSKGKSDVRFVKYLFDLLQVRIKQISQGTAQDNLSVEKIQTLKFKVPSLNTQQKIATILSAYDDLIENNLKRIKLLEEMAQQTYEEWFVRMRFPGYETAVMNEETGLPTGWEIGLVGSQLKKVKSTIKIKSSDIKKAGSIPVVDQSRDFIAGYTDEELAAVQYEGIPFIVFGDHTRVLKLVNFDFARGADGTQIIVSDNKRMPQHLFYLNLLNIDLSNYHYARHFKYLKDTEIIFPTENLAILFEEKAKTIFCCIKEFRNQNQRLKEARDILLPRLMSGMIKV